MSTAEALTFDELLADAQRAAVDGMTRADDHADPLWKARAWQWLVDFLETHAEFFPDEDCRQAPQPTERRAWGALVQRAAREGLIVKSGQYRQRTSGNLSPAIVWRSTLHQDTPW